MEETFQMRLKRRDRQEFERSARSLKMSLAAFLREAAREKASRATRRAACLAYPDQIALSPEAERNPKEFIRSKLRARHAIDSSLIRVSSSRFGPRPRVGKSGLATFGKSRPSRS